MSRLCTGCQVAKDDPLLEACGTVDELSACIGAVRAEASDHETGNPLARIQSDLLDVGSDLSFPPDDSCPCSTAPRRIEAEAVERLEAEIDAFEKLLPALKAFILPAGSREAALLHVARAVCRRAERRVASLIGSGRCNPEILRYLNRLSDWLFVAARQENSRRGFPEEGRKGESPL